MNMKRAAACAALVCLIVLSACQPTPETPAVQYKGSSLIDKISGNFDYEPEDLLALNGQKWIEEIYNSDNTNVTVDAQILCQERYPAVRIKEDTERFLHSEYLKKMVDYFFDGYQPYYSTDKPNKNECTLKVLWMEKVLSSKSVINRQIDIANELLEQYKNETAAAPEDVPFTLEEDPFGEKFMWQGSNGDVTTLVAYPNDGVAHIGVSRDGLSYSMQNSLDQYDYEVELDSLSDVPASVAMDASSALNLAKDSVEQIAAGENMELVRMATINRVCPFTTDFVDYQHLEPNCLVFYFMRSYDGTLQTFINPAAIGFFSHDGDPEYEFSRRVHPECIRVVVDGASIVKWSWDYVGLITNTISSNASLMSFEQIKDIFRQQIKNHYTSFDVNEIQNIHIHKVVLGLMKTIEKDNSGDYLIIPVWDFIGTENVEAFGVDYGGGHADYSYMTINAIDGTLIDRGLGY